MRSNAKKFLQTILRFLAIWTIRKYSPDIIGITGSVGKTSAKDAIYAVLRDVKTIRASSGNFNNEIGLPLTILGNWQSTKGLLFWIKVIVAATLQLLVRRPYPEILILEYAADRPGDIKYLTEIARPRIAVVTAVGDTPVHVEFYSNADAVAREKARLVEVLPASGFAVLCADDARVAAMEERTRARVITFGFGEASEVGIQGFEHRISEKGPEGVFFKLSYGGSFVPVRLDHALGRGAAYAAAAAAAVGIAMRLHLVRVSESLSFYEGPPHRMKLVQGKGGVRIVDDTYNASPLSMRVAIETLEEFPGTRKIAVLGDMRELGTYAETAHEEAGKLAARVFDVVIAVGEYADVMVSAARKAGLSKKNAVACTTAREAKEKLLSILKKGDMVLVKGSRALGLEAVVEAIGR